jgi:AcrR family transcriptional regulator
MRGKEKARQQKYHHGDLRKAILDAALEMTEESGLESLSLREIARRIGVTTAAPYHHFKDRQTLLIELAIRGYRELLEALRQARAGAVDSEDQVRQAARCYLDFGRRHRALYAIMLSGEFASHARLQEMQAVADQALDLVRQSMAASSHLGPHESTQAAFCAWSLLHGILTLDRNGVLYESAAEQDSLAIQGVRALVLGIGGQQPAHRNNP